MIIKRVGLDLKVVWESCEWNYGIHRIAAEKSEKTDRKQGQ